jgi:Outer membrane protein beta-barrel domain
MKTYLSITALLIVFVFSAKAQDEGKIVKRERIERDKGIFVGGGISLINDSNLKEYSTGFNFEGGYSKRLNRVLAVGASISYLSFAYDTPPVNQAPVFGKYPDNFYSGYQDFPEQGLSNIHTGYIVNLNNTKLTFISLAANLKLNFVPIKENSVISVYGFAKPFISISKHSDINVSLDGYFDANNNNTWAKLATSSDVAKVDSQITGGIFLGPGIEINPTKPISFFLQASFGYTFASDFINTKSYPKDLTVFDTNSTWPSKSIGFSSINFAGGISFNLD